MKKIIQLAVLLPLAALATGCATPYMIDRGRDAADILTATVGKGAGAKARLGPLHAGLFYSEDKAGLRGGEFVRDMATSSYCEWTHVDTLELETTIFFYEAYFPQSTLVAKERNKLFCGMGLAGLAIGGPDEFVLPESLFYLTQIEVAAGLGGTLRLGFNPGELLDFILGFTTIDIFNDDLEKRKSNNQMQNIGTDAPNSDL